MRTFVLRPPPIHRVRGMHVIGKASRGRTRISLADRAARPVGRVAVPGSVRGPAGRRMVRCVPDGIHPRGRPGAQRQRLPRRLQPRSTPGRDGPLLATFSELCPDSPDATRAAFRQPGNRAGWRGGFSRVCRGFRASDAPVPGTAACPAPLADGAVDRRSGESAARLPHGQRSDRAAVPLLHHRGHLLPHRCPRPQREPPGPCPGRSWRGPC